MPVPVFKSIFPYTQELFSEYPIFGDTRIEQAITNASAGYYTWKKFNFYERGRILKNVAAILRREEETLAVLITREMGKMLSEAKGELQKCAVTAEYFADHS